MAKKQPAKPVAKVVAKAKEAPVSTPVRNTAIPKAVSAKPARVVTHDMIAYRAYEISCSHERGSDHDNWCRAERELKGL